MKELNYILKVYDDPRFCVPEIPAGICYHIDVFYNINENVLSQIYKLIDGSFHTKTKLYKILRSLDYIAYIDTMYGEVIASLLVCGCTVKEIHYVVTKDEWRRKNMASSLVNYVTDSFRYIDKNISHFALSSKPELRPLYEGKCGFTVI